MIRRLIETTTLLLLSISAVAQLPSTGVSSGSGVLDGVYVQEHIPTKRVIQYTHLREADVMWSKRVWRTIDLREKQNHPLYYPIEPISDRMSLFDVIKYGATEEGSITLYDFKNGVYNDDQFRFPVIKQTGESDEEFKKRVESFFGTITVAPKFDPVTGAIMYDTNGIEIMDTLVNPYTARDIIKYEIKEDWFFDKQRSVMDVRIIGIAPIVNYVDPNTNAVIGTKTLFYLYFPECRYLFQNFFVYNPHNDAQRMSFDDLFWKRDFNSYIHKESNVYDRAINPNWLGVDALLESEKIKGEMFRMEHDLWNL
ncbi:type IX secretion system ring protein PorN/GldN [Parvicella tangerina]|nr:gliding motility protein GldN [Parvicella tangerina]